MGASGLAAKTPTTILDSFDATVAKHGTKPALHQKIVLPGKSADETPWTHWTWAQYRTEVDNFAKALISLDFQPFDIVNIIGFNSPEWLFANFGAMAAGGIAAGIYATNLPDACKYISEHSQAKVVVVEGLKQLEKYYEISADLPSLKAIVMYGPDKLPADIGEKCPVPVYTYADFSKLGKDVPEADLKDRTSLQQPNNTCTLIYTSGTTGNPKAVMITHDNITWTVDSMLTTTPHLGPNDHMISFLPLSHIAAQMLDMHNPMKTGMQVWFAQPDALKGSLGGTLKDVRPTVFFGVPRVWEKMYDKLQEVAKASTGIKKMLSTWAKGTSLSYWKAQQYGAGGGTPCMVPIANKLLHKAHVALGLDRCNFFYTAAAPIEAKILWYFASINIPIFEIFGQSECTGPHTVNKHGAWKVGTVGRPLPGTETVIVEETGELIYRGRHIFAGYMGMDDKTEETIDDDGWLHSGDIAVIDSDVDPNIPGTSGFVSITGRIKELIITAGGENIPPVLIEEEFKAAMPALSNCMVIGDKRKFLSILFCLHVEIDDDGVPTEVLTGAALEAAKSIGSTAITTAEVQNDPLWKQYFDNGMRVANDKATSRAQKVSKWVLLPSDFSEKGGELTPTLKLKRKPTAEKYSEQIEGIYAE